MNDVVANWILLPVFGHLTLIFILFVIVSWKRMQATKVAGLAIDDLAHTGREPELSRRWARNLDNQFQLPMLFYGLVALLFATNAISQLQIALAWVFLFGRIVHTFVQLSGDNVTLRGRVFTINFVALAAMWLVFLYSRLATL